MLVHVWAEPDLRGEHGDVVELAPSTLLHRDGQKEPGPVPGEHGLLVLERRDGTGF